MLSARVEMKNIVVDQEKLKLEYVLLEQEIRLLDIQYRYDF